jgi:hypothetical protein
MYYEMVGLVNAINVRPRIYPVLAPAGAAAISADASRQALRNE